VKVSVVVAAIATLSVFGCNKPAAFSGSSGHGRYAGVGLYPAGQMWSQIAAANTPKDASAARPNDDEQVIVVLDTVTGELRQCGNLTGYCVGMNPWAKPLVASQIAPIPLAKHADQIAQEAEAAAKANEARPPTR
jgi:hypothetical protein